MRTCECPANSFFESNHTGEAGVERLPHADGLQCSQPLDFLFAALDRYAQMRPNAVPPRVERKQPETFC
jgi:hypothetical protein